MVPAPDEQDEVNMSKSRLFIRHHKDYKYYNSGHYSLHVLNKRQGDGYQKLGLLW
jgi:hypothetical protein